MIDPGTFEIDNLATHIQSLINIEKGVFYLLVVPLPFLAFGFKSSGNSSNEEGRTPSYSCDEVIFNGDFLLNNSFIGEWMEEVEGFADDNLDG